MPTEIHQIALEPLSQSRSHAAAYAFAHQYAAIIAEHNIQNYALQQRRRPRALPNWLPLAIAAGCALAWAFIYFFD